MEFEELMKEVQGLDSETSEVTTKSEKSKTMTPAQKNIEEYTKRFLNLELQKKAIQEDIKALREEYKEEGVPVQVVNRVINQLKREKRQTEGEIHEEIVIREWLEKSTEIDDDIGNLIAKP